MTISNDTIAAIATGKGGAISTIRLSGGSAIEVADKIFRSKKRVILSEQSGFTLHYGNIVSIAGEYIDDVILSLFRAPKSYTGEDMVEISCHGSEYILQEIMLLLLGYGARVAEPGEFTLRAYCNGKMDLVQAEAVADLISSNSRMSHRLAQNQVRGGYSSEFSDLRSRLLNIISLMELELDFGEEDVEFADISKLKSLLEEVLVKIELLTKSFSRGNAIKNGIPVAIVGRPNAGKSTLLNALLRDDRAIVSDIAGTTRDIIEESIILGGLRFRFIDTAGIRSTDDKLEIMGIERTLRAVSQSEIVLYVSDLASSEDDLRKDILDLGLQSHQRLIVVRNKIDMNNDIELGKEFDLSKLSLSVEMSEIFGVLNSSDNGLLSALKLSEFFDTLKSQGLLDMMFLSSISKMVDLSSVYISARDGIGISWLEEMIVSEYSEFDLDEASVLISNMRHYEILVESGMSISRCLSGINSGLPTDLITQDLRESVHYIGSLTGEITTDEILGNIFANFCIGK